MIKRRDSQLDIPAISNRLKTLHLISIETAKQEFFIYPDIVYTVKDLTSLVPLLNQFPPEIFEAIFFKSGNSKPPHPRFMMEVSCSHCSKTFIDEKVGRGSFILRIQSIANKGSFYSCCKRCERKAKQEEREKQKQRTLQWKEESGQWRQKSIDRFISDFLDPSGNWEESFKPYQKVNRLLNLLPRDKETQDIIARCIKSLKYSEFLKTPYWKGIAEYKRQRAKFRCELCNKDGMLHVHHKTYESHGYELFQMDDLIVLCAACHAKFHDKEVAENA